MKELCAVLAISMDTGLLPDPGGRELPAYRSSAAPAAPRDAEPHGASFLFCGMELKQNPELF